MIFSRSSARALAAILLSICLGAAAEPPAAQAQLDAAQAAADAGDTRRAQELLGSVAPEQLASAERSQMNILRAQLLLARGQPEEALKWLSAAAAALPPQQAQRVHWLRAQALFRLGNGPSATYELVEREKYLSAPQITENRDAIWAGLFQTPMDVEVLNNLKNLDVATRGWVELAILVRERVNIDDWRARYPGHPGETRASGIRTPAPRSGGFFGSLFSPGAGGDSLALLLPLSGAYAATAAAVRDGFLDAYFSQAGSKPRVKVYDSGASANSTVAAYQQALAEGAGFIIGPLRKDGVAAIAALGQPPAPMLALNYLEQSPVGPPVFNLFQFGLAPEDEARAAAARAVSEGGRRAIVLAPTTDWGDRAHLAFAQRLQELGGSIVGAGRYELGARDYSKPIRDLLAIGASEERHRALSNTLAQTSEFEPRRRDDVDFIFIAARPAEGQLIWPQMRYNRSGALPVYATSMIYSGRIDTELNGMRFCDMPWMLHDSGELANARAIALELPSAKSQPRLYALGRDAYSLARLIAKGEFAPGATRAGASGELSMDGNGVIGRHLLCAQIDGGQPRMLEALAAPP